MHCTNRSNRRYLGLACGLVSLVLLSSIARAAPWDTRERNARKACLKGNVDHGVELLTDLFLETKDPTFIYNQGRCYEQNHRYEDAVSRFREFLIKAPQLSDETKAETQQHIDACLRYLGKSEASTPVAPTPQPVAPVVVASPAAEAPAPLPAPVAAVEQTPTSPDGQAGSGLRVAGIVTAAFGGAAVLTGVLLNLKVNSMANDLEAHYSSGTRSSQQNYKTMSEVSYGVGAVCIAGGAVLYYLGWSKGQGSSGRVSLAPAISPAQLGAILGGTF